MFQLFYTPAWFQGWDLVFDAISLIIALMIAGYSWKVYRMSKENRFGYFSFSFILVSLGFIFKIISQGLVYFVPWRNAATAILVPMAGKSVAGINYSDLLFRSGFFAYMLALLGAWLLIFFISQKRSGRLKKYYEVSQIALFIYLVGLISFVSNFKYAVFYLTSAVILGMAVLNYYQNYLNTNRNTNAFMVMLSFIFILLSNIFFVFVFVFDSFYVFGELFLLVGFLILLYTYRKITRR